MNPGWIVFAALLWAPAGWAQWPEVQAPPHSRVENIGDQVRLNGIPMRMQRVMSGDAPKEILRFYRQALGPRLAEQTLPDGYLLAQGRGDYFLTVRIKLLGPGTTEILVSVSDARAARDAAGRPLGFQLPADTQLLSDMESSDAGKMSRQLVFINAHSVDANVDSLTRTLRALGYKPQPGSTHKSENKRVLMFDGANREARLIAVRKDGFSHVVLTTVQTP